MENISSTLKPSTLFFKDGQISNRQSSLSCVLPVVPKKLTFMFVN